MGANRSIYNKKNMAVVYMTTGQLKDQLVNDKVAGDFKER